MDIDAASVVARYHDLWADTDGEARIRVLLDIWSEDGVYADPDVPDGVHGRAALSEVILRSLEAMPGLKIVATTEVVVQGDRAWYRWSASADDVSAFDGVDFIEFAPDGRIARVTTFY